MSVVSRGSCAGGCLNEDPRQQVWRERGEDQGVTWKPCFIGRVISEDKASVCRNMGSWEQAGMMPAHVCDWSCMKFKDLSYRDS